MRVLHICIYFRNPMFMGLMNAQEQLGIDKRVFYYETRRIGLKAYNLPYVDSYSYTGRFLPSPYLRFARLLIVAKRMLEKYAVNHEYDCVHAHTLIEDGYLALQIHKKWGIPYVITVRDSDFHFKPYWHWGIYKNIISEIIENADSFIFLSKSSERTFGNMLKECGINISNIVSYVIPNGVDSFWHEHRYYRTDEAKSPKSKWRIITVGKICKRKNQVTTCEAVSQLVDEGYDIEYEIIGKQEDVSMAKTIAEYRCVSMREFMNKEELIKEYRKNDIFLLASTNETFGLVYAEAMTQGLPVIYTKGQGFDEQFSSGEVGYAVQCDSIEQIKKEILHVMDNYNELTKRCSEKSKVFDWNIVAREFKTVYENTI